MNGLDLFSGIGGITCALEGIVKPIAYCEIDPYCQSVLLSRMQTGDLPKAPIWDDIKEFSPHFVSPVPIDIIYGGFPCQDISVAGHGKGLAGERSGLFFEILRLSKEIKPSFIFLENVPAITGRGGLQVVREITSLGYDCRWCVISAASVGALHRRERWFLLAYARDNGESTSKDGGSSGEVSIPRRFDEQEEDRREAKRASGLSSNVAHSNSVWESQQEGHVETQRRRISNSGEDVAHSKCERLEGYSKTGEQEVTEPGYESSSDGGNTDSVAGKQTCKITESEHDGRETRGEYSGLHRPFTSREHWQETVSTMGKCSDGLPYQMDRLKGLGNAVVPQQVRRAWEILTRGV